MLFEVFGQEAGSCCGAGGAGGGAFLIGDKAFLDCKFGGAGVIWIVNVVLVDDRMDHDCLFVNCQS